MSETGGKSEILNKFLYVVEPSRFTGVISMGNNSEGRRPLDVLDRAKGDRVIANLKNGATVSGELKAFDLHLNMWLENASVTDDEGQTDYGKLLVRGDNVIVVSPE